MGFIKNVIFHQNVSNLNNLNFKLNSLNSTKAINSQ